MNRALLFGGLVLLGAPAFGNPRALPMTYTSEINPPGVAEIETFVDLEPLRARSTSTGNRVWYLASTFQTEFEIGLAEHWELGLYLSLTPSPGDAYANTGVLTEGNGVKQRIRYAFANPGEWPIDVNLYGEVAENHKSVELEEKIILQRRIGALRLVANATVEQEFYYTGQRDIELEWSAGATTELTPAIHLGLEAWSHTEWSDPAPNPRPFGLGPHVYVGPTVMFQMGKLWWSNGVYVRATDFSHTMVDGEIYGPIWVRTMLGYDI